jgi:mRNA-degrading endonuclease toxin of MazEF toxin-antitoxin module
MRRGDIWTVAGGRDYAGKPRPVVIVRRIRGARADGRGCPRTSNFPELAEAQTLLAALGSDPSALRQRRWPESRKIKRAGQLVRRVPR